MEIHKMGRGRVQSMSIEHADLRCADGQRDLAPVVRGIHSRVTERSMPVAGDPLTMPVNERWFPAAD